MRCILGYWRICLAIFAMVFLCSTPVLAATSYQELWATTFFTTANGYTPGSVQAAFAPFVGLTTDQAAAIIAAEDSGNAAGALSTLNEAAAAATTVTQVSTVVGGAGGTNPQAVYISPAGATARFVFTDLVAPSPAPLIQIKMGDTSTATRKSRSFGATGRAQIMEIDDQDADLYGLSLGVAMDVNDRTFGLIYVYEYIDYEVEIDDLVINQNTLIAYIQQHIPLAENYEAMLTGNVNYTYQALDWEHYGDRINNIGGAGASSSITYDDGLYVGTLGLAYSFSQDDTNREGDQLEILKAGTVLGLRQGENTVYDVSLVYNRNLTGSDDDDSFEAGAKLQHYFTDTWNLTVGYKKVLGLDDFDADEYVLGSNWNF